MTTSSTPRGVIGMVYVVKDVEAHPDKVLEPGDFTIVVKRSQITVAGSDGSSFEVQ
jgi:hypothetical protein